MVMNIIAYWYSDKMVLALSGAKPIQKQDDPELYRVVENLSIAAGLPMPKLYIINDATMNAFATGRDPNHAVIAVTRTLRNNLEKTELEGVLAHELSHIGNRDMLISTVVVVLVGVIATMANIFLRMSFWGGMRRDDRDRSGGILALVGIIAAILAPIAAMLLQLAISRKREFLADASGALLTRYPDGLARALEKISSGPINRNASTATAHLYFENPFGADRASSKTSWIVKLFMTHPPIEERIKALRNL